MGVMKTPTKEVGHEHIVCKRMVWPYRDQGFGLAKGVEARRLAITLSPSLLLLDVVEEGDHVAKAILEIYIPVRDTDEQDLELFRGQGASKKHGENVIYAPDIVRLLRRQTS